ncbi:hypothetical protein ACLI4Z_09265 [Natrialbaceae archaeon A-arb3/5]
MVPWGQIGDFILGDYENQIKGYRRLRSEYKPQIRRLEREGEETVQTVEGMNMTYITEGVHDAHLDADNKIRETGDLQFGEYEFKNCGDEEKKQVKAEMKRVVDACNRQIWKYKLLSASRGLLFLALVTVVSVVGIGSLL